MKPWRVWIILLLALLLPLRSTLAATMMMAPAHTPSTMAGVSSPSDAMPCPHHAAAETAPDAPQVDEQQAHLLCDACNGQALSATVSWAEAKHTPPISAAHRSERFDSVVPPIGHKPPIPV